MAAGIQDEKNLAELKEEFKLWLVLSYKNSLKMEGTKKAGKH